MLEREPHEEEEIWIIPTSGHRAYPYWQFPLYNLDALNEFDFNKILSNCPPSWPDHYQVSASPGTGTIKGLFNLLFKPSPINRRL
jgi:hypothetical protein